MTDVARLKWLRVFLVMWGITCFAIGVVGFAKTVLHPTPSSGYEQMLQSLYFVLGAFLFLAYRTPARYVSLMQFAIWSSVAHGSLMAVQVSVGHYLGSEHHHSGEEPKVLLIETVGLFIMAITLQIFLPKRMDATTAPALDPGRLKWLRNLLVIWGLVYFVGVGIIAFINSVMSPYVGADVDQMLQSLYLAMGILLLLGARHPTRSISLARYAIWSSVAHGGLMIVQSILMKSGEHAGHHAEANMLLFETIPLAATVLSFGLVLPKSAQETLS